MDKILFEIETLAGFVVHAKTDGMRREYVTVTSPYDSEDGTSNIVFTPFLRPGTALRCAQEIAAEI